MLTPCTLQLQETGSNDDAWTSLRTTDIYYQFKLSDIPTLHFNEPNERFPISTDHTFFPNNIGTNERPLKMGSKREKKKTVERRNARERKRVQTVNSAFAKLRKAVPIENSRGKRISKVKTLHKAIEYINALAELLREHDYYGSMFLQNQLGTSVCTFPPNTKYQQV